MKRKKPICNHSSGSKRCCNRVIPGSTKCEHHLGVPKLYADGYSRLRYSVQRGGAAVLPLDDAKKKHLAKTL